MDIRLSWSKSTWFKVVAMALAQQFISFQILHLNLWAEYICTNQVHWIRKKFKRCRLKITYCTSRVFRKDLEVLSLEEITSPKCVKNSSTSLSGMSRGLYPKENVRNCEKKEVENNFYKYVSHVTGFMRQDFSWVSETKNLKKLHLSAMNAGNPSRKTQVKTSPQLVSPKPVESREQFARCVKGVTWITRIKPKVRTARDWEKDKAVVDLSGSRGSTGFFFVVTGFY